MTHSIEASSSSVGGEEDVRVSFDELKSLKGIQPANQFSLIHMYVHDTFQVDLLTAFPVQAYLHQFKGVLCVTVRRTANLMPVLSLIEASQLMYQGMLHILVPRGQESNRSRPSPWFAESDEDIYITLIASRHSVDQVDARLPLYNPTLEFVLYKQETLDTCRCLIERSFVSYLDSVMIVYSTEGIEDKVCAERNRHILRAMRNQCVSIEWTVGDASRVMPAYRLQRTSPNLVNEQSLLDVMKRTFSSGALSATKRLARVPRCGKCLHCMKKHWRKSCLVSRNRQLPPDVATTVFALCSKSGGAAVTETSLAQPADQV